MSFQKENVIIDYIFLDYTDKEREVLALKSLNFKCPILGLTAKLLLEKEEEEETVKDEIQKYSKELTVSKPANAEKSKAENNNSGKNEFSRDSLNDNDMLNES